MRIIRDVEHKLYVVKCVQANVVWTIKEISDVNQMRWSLDNVKEVEAMIYFTLSSSTFK